MTSVYYKSLLQSIKANKKQLAILIDPEKFDVESTLSFLENIPSETTHLFVGGSTDQHRETEKVVRGLKQHTELPLFLFPGNHSQITPIADALLFLTLLSGRNAEYLIGQQVKAVSVLKDSSLEVIATGYILIDGGNYSSVARVTGTKPLLQDNVEAVVHTALAGQYNGAKLIYLEAGSGAEFPVKPELIRAVRKVLRIPLIVGGGIKTQKQKEQAYEAGADVVVMGTVFESKNFRNKEANSFR